MRQVLNEAIWFARTVPLKFSLTVERNANTGLRGACGPSWAPVRQPTRILARVDGALAEG